MGVPILAYPMAKLNAKFVVHVLGIGLRIWPGKVGDGDGGGGVVASGDVQALVRGLVLGEQGKRAASKVSALATSARKRQCSAYRWILLRSIRGNG
jgi:hypothetical protein